MKPAPATWTHQQSIAYEAAREGLNAVLALLNDDIRRIEANGKDASIERTMRATVLKTRESLRVDEDVKVNETTDWVRAWLRERAVVAVAA